MITGLKLRETKKGVLGKEGLGEENQIEIILKRNILIETTEEQGPIQEVIQVEIISETILEKDNYLLNVYIFPYV